MPTFYTDAELDVDVEEIYDELSYSEIDELVNILVDGHVVRTSSAKTADSQNNSEWLFSNMIGKIISNRLRLTKEEEELLQKISNRF